MKVIVNFSLSIDIAKLLQDEQNRSQLVEGLLRNYFSVQAMENNKTAEEAAVLKEVGL